MSEPCTKPGHTGWVDKCCECLEEFKAKANQIFVDADKAEQLEKINGWLATPKEG
jgi:hypothetical protein